MTTPMTPDSTFVITEWKNISVACGIIVVGGGVDVVGVDVDCKRRLVSQAEGGSGGGGGDGDLLVGRFLLFVPSEFLLRKTLPHICPALCTYDSWKACIPLLDNWMGQMIY